MTSTDQSALAIGYLANAGNRLAIGWLSAGYRLAIGCLSAIYRLAMGYPSAGYGLAINWLWDGYGLAIGPWVSMSYLWTGYWLAKGWLSAQLLLIQWQLYLSNELYFISINKYVYNRPAILTPVCSEPAYLYNMWAGVKRHYVCLLLCLKLPMHVL